MSGEAIGLQGVRAETPMGALVAFGLLALLARQLDRDQHDPRLSWVQDEAGWHARLQTTSAGDIEELAEITTAAIRRDDLSELSSIAADLNGVMPADLVKVLASNASPVRDVLASLCSEFPLRAKGQAAMTPLCVTSFKGRRSVFGTIQRADAVVAEDDLVQLLRGPWAYTRAQPTLGLDPAARQQDSARLAVDASADGPRGVAGSVPLAVRGLLLLPPLVAKSRPRVAGCTGDTVAWPIWTAPMGIDAVAALVGRSWERRLHRGDTLPPEVEAVFSSRIVAAKDGRRLAKARRLA